MGRPPAEARLVGLGPPVRPLLDGSAFADLPRKGVPVEVFYLPLHENWPSPMEGNYNGDYWADRAFPESYRRAFVAASRRIAEHFAGQGMERDALPGLLNNKNNFKATRLVARVVPLAAGRAGQLPGLLGPSLLRPGLPRGDQPGRGTEDRTVQPPPAALVFRADISRPQWRRDSLDGLLDYHVVGGAMRIIPGWSSTASGPSARSCWNTARPTRSRARTSSPLGWCLDAWSLGTDGVLPWQTVGTPTPGSGPTSWRCSTRGPGQKAVRPARAQAALA